MADRSARKSSRSSKAPNVIKLVMPDTKTPSQRLKNVHQLLKDEEIEPLEWITETACKEITARVKSTYFVVDPFEGEAFEHLKSLKCFVVGAQVMVQCVKDGITIPRCDYPIFHMALRNAVISLSGIREGERDEMYRKIQLMNGRVEKSLTLDVTHLVSLTTGASSKKYIVAAEKGIPVLSPKWLNFCWDTGKNEPMDGTSDDVLAKFRCPLFEGMKFCASGYEVADRNYIKDTVIAEGGTYSGEMRLQNCSHLIVKEPTGPKFQCAQKWKIRCIRIEWIRESVAKGYCQDENNYVVEGEGSGGSTSTPERKKVHPDRVSTSFLAGTGAPRFSVSSDISIIDHSHVNETMWNSTMMSSTSSGSSNALPNVVVGIKKPHVLDVVNVAELTKGKKTLFLDGCKIYVHGMPSHHAEKCVKLINSGFPAQKRFVRTDPEFCTPTDNQFWSQIFLSFYVEEFC